MNLLGYICKSSFANKQFISSYWDCSLIMQTGDDLIAPCHCRGTQKYVHRSCLDNWRSTKVLINVAIFKMFIPAVTLLYSRFNTTIEKNEIDLINSFQHFYSLCETLPWFICFVFPGRLCICTLYWVQGCFLTACKCAAGSLVVKIEVSAACC